jgi:hypothetical protein
MTVKRKSDVPPNAFKDEVPPGATRKAFDREDNGGGPEGSPLGDRHAIGDTMGSGLVGESGGANDEELEQEAREEENGPFAGPSGGAVGGTPAEGRASGGHMTGKGFSPGSGSTRGDSTIGSNPPASRRKKK